MKFAKYESLVKEKSLTYKFGQEFEKHVSFFSSVFMHFKNGLLDMPDDYFGRQDEAIISEYLINPLYYIHPTLLSRASSKSFNGKRNRLRRARNEIDFFLKV